LALFAVRQVRKFGGVLEHPASSTLWNEAGLPRVGERDGYGGFSMQINQSWFGHRAEKKTWLYICGVWALPDIPLRLEYPSHVVQSRKRLSLPHITKAEREQTPMAFAQWLIGVARESSLLPAIS